MTQKKSVLYNLSNQTNNKHCMEANSTFPSRQHRQSPLSHHHHYYKIIHSTAYGERRAKLKLENNNQVSWDAGTHDVLGCSKKNVVAITMIPSDFSFRWNFKILFKSCILQQLLHNFKRRHLSFLQISDCALQCK